MTAARTVLVTGAFGNLGQMMLAELKRQSFRVLAMDLDNPVNRKVAANIETLYDELVWGDLRTVDFKPLLQGLHRCDSSRGGIAASDGSRA
ncbi:MAG: hypothetical protein IPK30_12120 [Cellvibrionales bacterium]|nr:hypothetical protein [Cellvibrionales bacterium]